MSAATINYLLLCFLSLNLSGDPQIKCEVIPKLHQEIHKSYLERYGLDVSLTVVNDSITVGDNLRCQLILMKTKSRHLYNPLFDFNHAVPLERITIYDQNNQVVSVLFPKVKNKHLLPPKSLWHKNQGIVGREFVFTIKQGEQKPVSYLKEHAAKIALEPGKYFLEATWNTLFLSPIKHYHYKNDIPESHILWACEMESTHIEVSRKVPFTVLPAGPIRSDISEQISDKLSVELTFDKEQMIRGEANLFQVKWVNRTSSPLTLTNPYIATFSTLQPYRFYMTDSSGKQICDSLELEYKKWLSSGKLPESYDSIINESLWLTLPPGGILLTRFFIKGGRNAVLSAKDELLPLGKYSFQLVCYDDFIMSSEWGDFLQKVRNSHLPFQFHKEFKERCKKEYEKFTGKAILRSNVVTVEMIDPTPKEKEKTNAKLSPPMKK